jgi:hypothetical protein
MPRLRLKQNPSTPRMVQANSSGETVETSIRTAVLGSGRVGVEDGVRISIGVAVLGGVKLPLGSVRPLDDIGLDSQTAPGAGADC